VRRLIDIRLHPSSQLAGFARGEDLPFFLRELCDADYVHEPLLAPSQELFDAYKKQHGEWNVFRDGFTALLRERRVEDALDRGAFDTPTALLCSEADPAQCHRSLIIDYLERAWGDVYAVHLPPAE
jgi:Domain of unknown function DUF488